MTSLREDSVECEVLVDLETKPSLDRFCYADENGKILSPVSTITMVSREKGRMPCSTRLAVMLTAIAFTFALCSVWLCLDMKAMLVREAGQVKKIKELLEKLYRLSSVDSDSNDYFSLDLALEDLKHNLALDYPVDVSAQGSMSHIGSDASGFDVDNNRDAAKYTSNIITAGMIAFQPYLLKNSSQTLLQSEVTSNHNQSPSLNSLSALQCDLTPNSWKFDCHPESGANEQTCQKRGCCWHSSSNDGQEISTPYCFYPKAYQSYLYANVTETGTGFLAFLNRVGKSYYPEDVSVLRMDVTFETENRLHVKVTDALSQRFEVPFVQLPRITTKPEKMDYNISFLPNWGFQIIRKSTGEILFDTSVAPLFFCNQFIQLSSLLPSTYLYGLGEQRDSFLRSFDWSRSILFASDHIPQENTNLYGVHPFYLMIEGSSQSHGVFLLNSNAMEIVLQPTPAITYRTIGGTLDFYFFLGPNPSDVISQYTELIGRPFLPPYWSLGFHLCRFNYGTVNETRKVWQRTRDAGIPFDVQWNDLDYMSKRRDFTLDKEKFGDLETFVQDIHEVGMHYIPIIDSGIAISSKRGEYLPYDAGCDMNVFIKDSSGEKDFVGQVWPGETVWPDFTNPNATMYWTMQLKEFYKQVPIDGAWIDMNEPSNFLTGTKDGCPKSDWDNPPYVPAVTGEQLAYKTICMSAKQFMALHYDIHNLYGFTETIATNYALTSIRMKRPFIISRSTFPGQGVYGGHWTGDIASDWHDMGRSVADILNFNLFGIPMVGADICGFNGNTTVKLCQRWMELGAFYPFSRNHNTDDAIDQDPVALGPDVVIASLNALYVRYQLLPYLYTLFFRAHVSGTTVARPLFFEFPKDRQTYVIDTQFLWGMGLMILPVLEEDVTTIYPYFPSGVWYLLPSHKTINSTGSNFQVDSPLDTITVALRGGAILPVQAVNQSTTASRLQMFGLWVALDGQEEAVGEVFWDDGDTIDTIQNEKYNLLSFQAKKGNVSSTVEKFGYHDDKVAMTLGSLTVFGVKTNVTTVFVNGAAWQFFHFDTMSKKLDVQRLQVRMEKPFIISWH